MSTDAPARSTVAGGGPAADPVTRQGRPCYVGRVRPTLLAHLHPGATGAVEGVVVVPPLGYEALTAHHALRQLAGALAEAGRPTVRLDLAGTGDSTGRLDGDVVEAWLEDIAIACDLVRRETGVSRVALVGVRLGATLAALYAARRRGVDALVLWAPVVSGKQYVREAHALAVLAAARRRPDPAGAELAEGAEEVVGWLFPPAAVAAWRGLDLAALPALDGVERALVVDRDDVAKAEPFAEQLRGFGVETAYEVVPGYQAMMLEDPTQSTFPSEVLNRIAAWFGAAPTAEAARTAEAPAAPAAGRIPAIVTADELAIGLDDVRWPGPGTAAGVVERCVHLGAGDRLEGIVTAPATPAVASGVGVVLLDAGAVPRVGPGRLYVDLARSWAAHGHTVLRVDFGGVGDSDVGPGERENKPYDEPAMTDVAAAVDYVRTALGVADVVVVGICAGAYNAFHAALRGAPVRACFLVNPIVFYWHEGDAVSDRAPNRVIAGARGAQRSMLSANRWKALVRGEVDVKRILHAQARFALLASKAGVAKLRHRLGLGKDAAEDVGRDLAAVVARGVDLVLVFGQDETGLAYLRMQPGDPLGQLQARPGFHFELVDGVDHIWSRPWAKDRLEGILSGHLDRLAASPGRASSPPRG